MSSNIPHSFFLHFIDVGAPRQQLPVFSPQDINQMSVAEWQQYITIDNQANLSFVKPLLQQVGVVLIKNFSPPQETSKLSSAVKKAFTLADRQERGLKLPTLISGKSQMLHVPFNYFNENDQHFKTSASAMRSVCLNIGNLIGRTHKIIGDCCMLYAPKGAKKQFIHADTYLGDRFSALLVLSDTAPPTSFISKETSIKFPHIQKTLDGKLVDDDARQSLKRKYSVMWEPLETIEDKLRPVSSQNLAKGDLVLFEQDMLHQGNASTTDKTMLFFNIFPNRCKVLDSDYQLHPGKVGELIYGHQHKDIDPANCEGTDLDNFFNLVEIHDGYGGEPRGKANGMLGPGLTKKYGKWYENKHQ